MQATITSDKIPTYFNHPYLQTDLIEWREYQVNIAKMTARHNTLVVLPTALGKTIIALFTICKIAESAPKARILVLAPTRPLVQQHYFSFQKFLQPQIKCALFASDLSPVKRALALNSAHLIFSTPQIIQNDLQAGLYDLSGIGLIIFDEAHKAQKKYAYTGIAQQYITQCGHPLILGLTASPGKDLFKINELCSTLFIERIVFRDHESYDVKNYIFPTDVIIQRIDLPTPIIEAQAILETASRKIRDFMVEEGIFPKKHFYSKVDYLRLLQDLKILDVLTDKHLTEIEKIKYSNELAALSFPHLVDLFHSDINAHGKIKKPNRMAIFFQAINAIYLSHLIEILTTQDVRMFWSYLATLDQRAADGNARIKRLLNSQHIQAVKAVLAPVQRSPKIQHVIDIINNEFSENSNAKIIIFTQYREMGQYLEAELQNLSVSENIVVKPKRFVGQASRMNDDGLSQKEQHEIIQLFSRHDFNVLIATSVAEEGLDIPSVNAIIFYESVPSEIRLIQRRGRTGRHSPGKCYYLITPETLDQIYYNVSHRKEQTMKTILQNPNQVQTVPELVRTFDRPQHLEIALESLEARQAAAKILKEERKIEEIEKHIATHTHPIIQTIQVKPSNNGRAIEDVVKINDMTAILTEQARCREIFIQRNRKECISAKSTRKGGNKTHFNWIISTMECIGHWDPGHNTLICNENDLYAAAQEEGMELHKIRKEIAHCINVKTFHKQQANLAYLID
jgi:Fanconi anemia group M protein